MGGCSSVSQSSPTYEISSTTEEELRLAIKRYVELNPPSPLTLTPDVDGWRAKIIGDHKCSVSGREYGWWFKINKPPYEERERIECSVLSCNNRAKRGCFVKIENRKQEFTFILPTCYGHAVQYGVVYKIKITSRPTLCECSARSLSLFPARMN